MKNSLRALLALLLSASLAAPGYAGGPVESRATGRADAAAPSAAAPVPGLPAGVQGLEDVSAGVDASAAAPDAAASAASVEPAASLVSSPKAAIAAPAAASSRGEDAPASAESQLASAGLEVGQSSGLFDGLRAFAKTLIATPLGKNRMPKGVRLDQAPRRPEKGATRIAHFHLSPDHVLQDGHAARLLDADPSDPAAVESALKALVDSDPAKYGASSADMGKVHVKLVPGDAAENQADTYFAVFRQWKKGEDLDGGDYHLLVDGGALTFTIKVVHDKPYIMATEGRMYPGIDAAIMKPAFSDAQLDRIAAQRLQSPPDAVSAAKMRRRPRRRGIVSSSAEDDGDGGPSAPQLLTREIANIGGSWRAINLYQASDLGGRPIIVAVDVHTGEAFAFSAQSLLRSNAGLRDAIAAKVVAAGNELSDTGGDHGPVKPLALPYVYGFDASGRKVLEADADGVVKNDTGKELSVTFRLEGRFTPRVVDAHGKKNGPIEVTVTLKPGESKAIEIPIGDNDERVAAVNAYVYYTRLVMWLTGPGGIDDPRVAKSLAGMMVNKTDMPLNAYYNPANDTLNLEASQKVPTRRGTLIGENTAQPSIILHEGTHRAVQIFSQLSLTAEQLKDKAFRFVAKIVEPIMDGGVNEAIADTVSMYLRNSPLIGEGFIVDAPKGRPNLIRTGENTTKLDANNPDPHAQGEAYMGFTWKILGGLIERLGPARGAAFAAHLVVPTTLYSQPKDVPTAIMHVALASMTKDGQIPHLDLFREKAEIHGVEIPDVSPPSSGGAATLAARASSGRAAR